MKITLSAKVWQGNYERLISSLAAENNIFKPSKMANNCRGLGLYAWTEGKSYPRGINGPERLHGHYSILADTVQKRSTENTFTSCVCLWSPDLIPWGPVVTTGNGNHNGQLDHSGSKVNTTDAQVMDSLNHKACLTVLPALTTNTIKCNQCEVNTRHWGSIAEST